MTIIRKNELINEMLEYGESYLGIAEIRGVNVVKEYKALAKEVAKRFPDNVLVFCDYNIPHSHTSVNTSL